MTAEHDLLTHYAVDVARENAHREMEGAVLLGILHRGPVLTTGVLGAAATRYYDMPAWNGLPHSQANYLGIAGQRVARAHRIHADSGTDDLMRRGESSSDSVAYERLTPGARRIASQSYRGEGDPAAVQAQSHRALDAIPFVTTTQPLERSQILDQARQMAEFARTLDLDATMGVGVLGTAVLGILEMGEEFSPLTLAIASSREQRLSDPARGAEDTGTNYMGFALSKAARAIRQKIASHDYVFPGEVDAEGALAVMLNGILYVAAFSGGTQKQDVQVASHAIGQLVKNF